MTTYSNKLKSETLHKLDVMNSLPMYWFSLLQILLVSSAHATDAIASSGNVGSVGISGFDAMDVNGISQVLRDSDRKLVSQCAGPDELYYFEVYIRLTPSDDSGVCSVADQLMLGNDINQLLLDHGVGDAGVDDDAIFLAGICPQPTTATTTERRELLLPLKAFRFIWSGGGGCRFCLPESDTDARRSLRQLNDWFTNTFVSQTTATLEAALSTTVIPDHTNCLGSSPTIEVELVQVGLDDLRILCSDGRVIDSLETLRMGDIPLSNHNCEQCVSLDFSKFDDGSQINQGEWIGDQFRDEHGVSITASGGYSPNARARIFDTSDATCVNVDGSRDFGSPNSGCDGGGLGVGDGGLPGETGENCDPVGNVLIVQESDTTCPDSNSQGGSITFKWDEPVLLSDIGLMDVNEDGQRIIIRYADGVYETFTYQGFGENAVQRVVTGKMHVIEVTVKFPGTGAVTEINFCPVCLPLVSHDLRHHCLYTEDETMIKAQADVYYENFEELESEEAWDNGITASSSLYTRYLGRYGRYNPTPSKTIGVGLYSAGVIIELDFYEIDRWRPQDNAMIYVSGELVHLGEFNELVDEGHRTGTTPLGITWKMNSIDTPGYHTGNSNFKDQRHHVKMTVPRSSGLFHDATLRLTLDSQLSAGTNKVSAGWDHIKVTVVHECYVPETGDRADGCCSWDQGNCADFEEGDWCAEAAENCEDCNGYWIVPKELDGCLPMWNACLYSVQCCGSAECLVDGNGWSHCTIPEECDGCTAPDTTGCCSWDQGTCAEFSADDPWCNARSENCEDCNGYWIDPDEDCLAMWSDCTTSAECCGTAECLDRASDGWRHCNVPSNM